MSLTSLISCSTTLGLDEKYPTLMGVLVALEKESAQVDYDTFLKELTQRLGNVRTKEGRAVLFNLLDKDQTSNVTMDDLRSLAKEVGHIVTEEDLQEIFQSITKGEAITSEEFEKYLAKKVERNL
jgi:Ca2+-binding EF-hand superfamily protein